MGVVPLFLRRSGCRFFLPFVLLELLMSSLPLFMVESFLH
jgi:hypothetical protein